MYKIVYLVSKYLLRKVIFLVIILNIAKQTIRSMHLLNNIFNDEGFELKIVCKK